MRRIPRIPKSAPSARPSPAAPAISRDSPDRARVGGRVVGTGVIELAPGQLVEVGADAGVGGSQPRGQRRTGPGRGRRRRRKVRRAEQVPDRGPLPAEQLDVRVLGRRVVGVQLIQREQVRVDRGQQAGVEGAEEPGAFGGSGSHRPAGRRRTPRPCSGPAGRSRSRWSARRRRSALPCSVAERVPSDADDGHRGHDERERDAERDERAGGGPGKRLASIMMVTEREWRTIEIASRHSLDAVLRKRVKKREIIYRTKMVPRSVLRSFYSHSIVAGGLLVTSSTTRFTSGTSLVTRVEIRASTSSGSRAQSAVIASSLVTGRSTMGWP